MARSTRRSARAARSCCRSGSATAGRSTPWRSRTTARSWRRGGSTTIPRWADSTRTDRSTPRSTRRGRSGVRHRRRARPHGHARRNAVRRGRGSVREDRRRRFDRYGDGPRHVRGSANDHRRRKWLRVHRSERRLRGRNRRGGPGRRQDRHRGDVGERGAGLRLLRRPVRHDDEPRPDVQCRRPHPRGQGRARDRGGKRRGRPAERQDRRRGERRRYARLPRRAAPAERHAGPVLRDERPQAGGLPGRGAAHPDDLALQENGQAVLAGTVRGNADTDFAVARLNGDGSLDQRFHGDGRVAVDFGVNELGQAVALQTNGKIVVGGGGPRALIIGTPPVKERSCLLARLQGCTISGTNGDDILAGTDGNDVICRLSGNDVLTGKSGNDLLIGGYGADTMSGGGEADTLRGGPGNDALSGGPGNDLVIGETGKDGLKGNDGNDTLDAVDGLGGETVNGGGGTDQCTADPGDQVSNCE